MKSSDNNNIVSGFISRSQEYFIWDSWIPCFKCRKENLCYVGENQGYSSETKYVYQWSEKCLMKSELLILYYNSLRKNCE